MSRPASDSGNDEKPRGLRPWDAVRASKVQRAREQLKDPAYPSKKTLEAIAELLARKLAPEPPPKP